MKHIALSAILNQMNQEFPEQVVSVFCNRLGNRLIVLFENHNTSKVLFQRSKDLLALTVCKKYLKIVHSFVYLGRCISLGGDVENEISLRIPEAHLIFANLRCLWRCRETRLYLKSRVYDRAVRSLLSHMCETCTD